MPGWILAWAADRADDPVEALLTIAQITATG
jgi:hypothetical protein